MFLLVNKIIWSVKNIKVVSDSWHFVEQN